jgi:two-component system, cell cycle sensor histidine kinase and response regulator CckA
MSPDGRPPEPLADALGRSELRFRAIIDGFSDPLLCVDGDLLIRYVNAAVGRVLGYHPSELLAHPVDRLLHPDEREGLVRRFSEALSASGGTGVLEHQVRRADGAFELVETLPNSVADPTGRPLLVLHVRCVTERRRLEAQLLQRQKLETVGQLAGGVAHDFNNLLTVINSTAELGLADLPDGHPLREAFATILEAGERAAALTRQLLAFGRKQLVQPSLIDLDRALARLAPVLRRLIPEQIAIEIGTAPSLGSVRLDATQLDQVVLNLVVNGRDAMPGGGTLSLRTGSVLVDEDHAPHRPGVAPGRYAVLEVSDTGTGMDEATRARIFEPFFTTKGVGQGTGLGLSTVYGIVREAGGDVGCCSEPGRGTTFQIYLPLVEGAAEAGATAAAPPRGCETVLLVDDDAGLRLVGRRILERHGYLVLAAASGEEALQLAARHPTPIHLLLTDVVMPGMTGGELAERLRVRAPGTKVLFASGYAEEAVPRGRALQVDAPLIVKPYSAQDLPHKVRQVLDG